MFETLLPAIEADILREAGSVPVVLKGMNRSFRKGDAITQKSSHDWYELLCVKNGVIDFEVEDQIVILKPGDVIVIRPKMHHRYRVRERQADMLVVYFELKKQILDPVHTYRMLKKEKLGIIEGELLVNDIGKGSIEKFIEFTSGIEDKSHFPVEPLIIMQGKSKKIIERLTKRILQENQASQYGQSVMLQLLSMELLIELSRCLRDNWEKSLRVKNGKASELVKIAKEYITENYNRDITIAEVAAYVFLSQGYFTRAFRESAGISPMNYLMQLRVEQACELLGKEDIKVRGIAAQVGFSSPQRFNAAFKKHKNMTPMEYRQKIIQK